MVFQRTLKGEVSLQGVGLHSGKSIQIRLKPALPDHGIAFVRSDLSGAPEIPAQYPYVVNTQMATFLGRGKVHVGTVEHLMAALAGLGIDNAVIEVDGPEVPIMDGSSAPFCEAILRVGVETQYQSQSYIRLRKKIELRLGEKWAVVEPADELCIFGSIEWDHPAIGYQEFKYQHGKTNFLELARARTFGFVQEVEALKAKGLIQGGSLANAVVLDHAFVLNPEGLRFSDEFARHKVLDALGDFKLAGLPIQGYFRLHRAGHEVHSQLLSEIFKDSSHYEIVSEAEREDEISSFLQPALATGYAI